ncbi:MAG: tetratricopeptide repeat protein [Pseudomonadota bacterium]
MKKSSASVPFHYLRWNFAMSGKVNFWAFNWPGLYQVARAIAKKRTAAAGYASSAFTGLWKLVKALPILVGAAVAATVALIFVIVFVGELFERPVIVEPFSVPTSLVDTGLTGDVLAQRFVDEVTAIIVASDTAKATAAVRSQARLADIQAPGSEISLRSLSRMLRGALGLPETRFIGEVVCRETSCDAGYSLRVRVMDGDVSHRPASLDFADETELNEGIEGLAIAAFLQIEPYYIAYHHYSTVPAEEKPALFTSEMATVETILIDMLRARHRDAAWAANLLGVLHGRHGRTEEAFYWYDEAIRLAEELGPANFAGPHVNKAFLHMDLQEFDQARRTLLRVRRMDRNARFVYLGLGVIAHRTAIDASGRASARRLYERQLRAEPTNAVTLGNLAILHLADGQQDLAEETVERALFHDPGSHTVREFAARIYLDRGEDPSRGARAMDLLRPVFERGRPTGNTFLIRALAHVSNLDFDNALTDIRLSFDAGHSDASAARARSTYQTILSGITPTLPGPLRCGYLDRYASAASELMVGAPDGLRDLGTACGLDTTSW